MDWRRWKEQTIDARRSLREAPAFGKAHRGPTLPGFALNLKAAPGRKPARRRRSSK